MGVFDFVKNAGAKVGIGKSTGEEAAEAAEAEAQATARAEADAKRAAARRSQTADKNKAMATATAARMADARDRAKKTARKAAAKERMAEYTKSNELEKYVADLGIDMAGIDIKFDDGTAYISGETADQATKERIILSVGNARGVGKVDEEIEVTEPTEEADFHTVAPGDTLWAVAEKVYGDGSRYTEIFEANKPMLKDADLIFPGQVLRCPK